MEIETSVVESGLGGVPTFELFGDVPPQDTAISASVGDTIIFYTTLSQAGFSVELVDLLDNAYEAPSTDESDGYEISLLFLDTDTYQVRARALHIVTGLYYYSENTIEVTIT